MSANKKIAIQIRDRKLGDEWTHWKGDLSNVEKNADSGKRIFLGVLLLTIFISGVSSFLIWYMIQPRLFQFHPVLPKLIGYGLALLWAVFSFWFLLMVLSILTEKDFLLLFGKKEYSLTFLVPLALRFGMQLGISRDRIGNSFVKVINALIRSNVTKVKPGKLLILLPRCLEKPIREKITAFSNALKIPVFTVPGGEMARQVILENKPLAIIGVACERDLVSGIQDVIGKIPVIGIPNMRPEGPCKNTVIDLKEFEKAVQTFLSKDIHPLAVKILT
jgi:hypothetical protein